MEKKCNAKEGCSALRTPGEIKKTWAVKRQEKPGETFQKGWKKSQKNKTGEYRSPGGKRGLEKNNGQEGKDTKLFRTQRH